MLNQILTGRPGPSSEEEEKDITGFTRMDHESHTDSKQRETGYISFHFFRVTSRTTVQHMVFNVYLEKGIIKYTDQFELK